MTVNNSLAKRDQSMKLSVYLQNDAVKKQINQVVGGKNGTRFISSIVSAVQSTPALQECTSPSIVNAALLGEALNLSPSSQLGQFYMVPFDNRKKGCKEAQFQLGYKGYIQLAERSGYYKKLNVLAIKEGELIRYDPLDEEIEVELIDDDVIREETPAMGYYAMFEYENGFRKTMYWSKKKMMAHAEKYSPAFSRNGGAKTLELLEQGKIPEKDLWKYSSFWFKDFDGMALKTMLRQLISKWGIMSIDLQKAIDKDMAVIQEDGSADYVENAAEELDKGMIDDLDTTASKKAMEDWAGVIEVPASRFFDKVTLTKTGAGGFATTGGKAIDFLIVDKNAAIQYQKHTVSKIITPEQNQTADAWKFGYRTVGIAEAQDNKKVAIYVHKAGE